ncbi:MAG TPA: FAD-dependent oxidoreductase [Polyangiaceae bacterium]|nr:FAD-dependent oxidoreductase [Polyangiaceae bacterium]
MSRLRTEELLLPRTGGARRVPRGTRAAVVGGGIAGVGAATVLCERGVEVTIIEKEERLGGRAGSFSTDLVTGERVEMERGFHAFFRQYYNLRALLRRIDPGLGMLRPLDDYPILGRGGLSQSFAGLPKLGPLQIAALAWKTPHLRAADIARSNKRLALEMLRFDPERTYARFDTTSAAAYLDSLAWPPAARSMLFDVFAHSFFNVESEMSAAELLMMFHFYATGNPEGLVFDVARFPAQNAIWAPFAEWLVQRGARLELGEQARRIDRTREGRWRIECSSATVEADAVVLALDVGALQAVVRASPDLEPLRPRVDHLSVAAPFAVWRMWLDRPMSAHRAPFAGTTGVGLLDNISIYDRFQDESARWANAHHGSVVELHAYAVRADLAPGAIKADLASAFHACYPEAREARAVDERFLLRRDCPSFAVGAHAERPEVRTAFRDLALAGDFVAMPIPCALMERATASGFLAANTVLDPLGVMAEPVRSVPRHGLFSPLRLSRFSHAKPWSRRQTV